MAIRSIGTPALGVKLPYDPIADFAPISIGMQSCNLLSVLPKIPANTLTEIIGLPKAG
jgi:hypothetical protein